MSTVWDLVMCLGVFWGGCHEYSVDRYPNEESCYRALANVKVETATKPVTTIAYCRPKQ